METSSEHLNETLGEGHLSSLSGIPIQRHVGLTVYLYAQRAAQRLGDSRPCDTAQSTTHPPGVGNSWVYRCHPCVCRSRCDYGRHMEPSIGLDAACCLRYSVERCYSSSVYFLHYLDTATAKIPILEEYRGCSEGKSMTCPNNRTGSYSDRRCRQMLKNHSEYIA